MATSNTATSPFLRKTTGLRQDISLLAAALFGVHCISLSSSGLIPFSWVASNWPGASILGLLIIAAGTSLLHGYTFAAIGAAMPRSGADYVLASRVLHPLPAFVASWTLVLFSGVAVGGLMAWIPKSVIPALFQPLSIVSGNSTWSSIATWSGTTLGSLAIGIVVLATTLVSVLVPNRIIVRMMAIGFVLAFAAWLVIFFSLTTVNDTEQFRQAWNKFVGPTSPYGSFDQRIALAKKAGMSISASPWMMTLGGLIMGFWIYYGYAIPTYFAGELKRNAHRYLLFPMFTAILFTCAIFSLGTVLLQRLVPLDWIAAEGFIANNTDAVRKAAGMDVPAFPWITFYAAILRPNPWLMVFVAIAWIFTLVNLFQTYFFYSSRVVFAWAYDGVVPSCLADVTRESGIPVKSLWLIAALAIIGLIDAALSGPIGPQLTFAFFAVVTQLVSVMAITLYPFLRRREFATKPPFVQIRLFGIPVISITGVLTFIYLLWMIIAQFLYPGVGIASPAKTLTILAIMLVSGFVWYLGRDRYLTRTQGLGLSAIYKLYPPEKEDA